MFIVTRIDPNGDDREVAQTPEDVMRFIEATDWRKVIRVIVENKDATPA